MAGYSGKPLATKLGLKEHHRFAILGEEPEAFRSYLDPLPVGLDQQGSDLDLIVFFTKKAAYLEQVFPSLISRIVQNGTIWISWPKKSSGVAADVNENQVRDIGLAAGVVDVKICAVDEVWSGLKFVRRLADRK